MRRVSERDRAANTAQQSMYQTEHWYAWLLAFAALALGAIGILRGFDIIGTAAEITQPDTGQGFQFGPGQVQFFDGLLWLLPAIALAFHSLAWHRNEHHLVRSGGTRTEDGLLMLEHGLAWLLAVGSLVMLAVGMLVGFNLILDDGTQTDGILWIVAAIGTGILVNTLHSVRHHQFLAEQEYTAEIVEERVGAEGRRSIP